MRPDPIVVVEDDPELREVIGTMLEDAGYAVLTAPNGRVAMELLAERDDVRLILLDLMMPVMNGWDFLAWMETSPFRSLPVVVMTASGVDVEGVPILRKPFDVEELLLLLRLHARSLTRAG